MRPLKLVNTIRSLPWHSAHLIKDGPLEAKVGDAGQVLEFSGDAKGDGEEDEV